MMTLVPTTPEEGVKPVIVGGVATLIVNEVEERLYGDSAEFLPDAEEKRRKEKLKHRIQRTKHDRRFMMLISYILELDR